MIEILTQDEIIQLLAAINGGAPETFNNIEGLGQFDVYRLVKEIKSNFPPNFLVLVKLKNLHALHVVNVIKNCGG